MSISNLSSSVSALPNLFPAPFTSANGAVIQVPVGVPLTVASKVLVLAKNAGAGANMIELGSINAVGALGSAGAGFKLTADSQNLTYTSGVADASTYYVKVYQ
jgi:hypothetical protein